MMKLKPTIILPTRIRATLVLSSKATGQSTFGDNIDLLDEMSICDIKPGHYAEVNLTKEEAELLKTGR